MSRVQSTDFDVVVCVWVRTVWLTSLLDVQLVSVPSLDMCEWIRGRVWTSVKCVKDARCIEGSCGDVVRLQTYSTGLFC